MAYKYDNNQLTNNHIIYLELIIKRISISQMEQITSMFEEPPIGNTAREEQTSERYTCKQFIQTLTNLHTESILFYCRYGEATLMDFYQQITAQKRTETLDKKTVLQFITELKEMNRQSLIKQIEFYQTQMNKLLQKKVKMVSRKEFRKITDRFQQENQLLTEIMIQNSKESDYIACDKVIAFTEEVKSEIEESFFSNLSITKLKTHRFSKRESTHFLQINYTEQSQKQMKQSNYLSEMEQYSLKKLLNRYIQHWHRKFNFYREFVMDEDIRQDMRQLDEEISQQEYAIFDEMNFLVTNCKFIQKKCHQFQDILQGIKDQQAAYENIIEQHQSQATELKEQLANVIQQNKKYLNENNKLGQTLQQTKSSIVGMVQQHEQIQRQLQNYKDSYGELYSQYERLIVMHSQETVLKKQEQTRKIFTDRTIKEQLEDTVSKLERTLTLREKERRQFKEKEEKHIDIIAHLETKLQQLQRQLKQKNEYLNTCIKGSKIISYTQSKIKVSMIPQIKSQISQCFLYDGANTKNKATSILGQKSKVEYIKQSKFGKVNICINAVIEEEEEANIMDGISLPEEQNLTKIIQQDNSSCQSSGLNSDDTHNKQTKKGSKIDVALDTEAFPLHFNKQTFVSNLQSNFSAIKSVFSSKGVIINSYGLKFQTTILLTKKRFCFFDTNVRLLRFLPVLNIKSFIFCYNNPTIFVVKVKHIKQLDPSKHIVNDMIFSTRNRNGLSHFISQQYRQILNQLKIEVNFKREEDILLSVDNKQLNLKNRIPGINSPLRLCLSTQPVFYGSILQSQGFFNSYKECCFIVQPSAVFCFEGDEIMQIQCKRQFLYLLPVVENMKIKQRPNSKEAPGRHVKISYLQNKSWERAYSLIFLCREDMKRFLKAVNLQLQQNHEKKQKIFNSKKSYITNPIS